MIQFQNDSVIVELANNATAIVLTWKGFIPSAKYREALDRSLEIAKKFKIKNWISDIRLMKVVAVKDQEWAGTEWLGKAVASGCYQKQAVIMPEDVFGQVSAKNMITIATVQNQQIEIQNFLRMDDAKAWLVESADKQSDVMA
jgi:hypothetical protein